MEFFRLLPDVSGYSWKPSGPVASRTELEGGFDVRRREFLGMTDLFQLQFVVGPDGLEYANDFMDAYFADPQWFHMLLLGLPIYETYPLQRYAVQVIPGSYKLTTVEGNRYTLAMTVEGYLDDDASTSRLYPVLEIDAMNSDMGVTSGTMRDPLIREGYSNTFVLLEGTLRQPIIDYENDEPEAYNDSFVLLEGTLKSIMIDYDNGLPEGYGTNFVLMSGTIKVTLIKYDRYIPEGYGTNFVLISGTLT